MRIHTCSFEHCSTSTGTHGGAIFNTGDMTIRDSSLTSCEASALGGAIFNSADAALAVHTSVLARNLAGKARARPPDLSRARSV